MSASANHQLILTQLIKQMKQKYEMLRFHVHSEVFQLMASSHHVFVKGHNTALQTKNTATCLQFANTYTIILDTNQRADGKIFSGLGLFCYSNETMNSELYWWIWQENISVCELKKKWVMHRNKKEITIITEVSKRRKQLINVLTLFQINVISPETSILYEEPPQHLRLYSCSVSQATVDNWK